MGRVATHRGHALRARGARHRSRSLHRRTVAVTDDGRMTCPARIVGDVTRCPPLPPRARARAALHAGPATHPATTAVAVSVAAARGRAPVCAPARIPRADGQLPADTRAPIPRPASLRRPRASGSVLGPSRIESIGRAAGDSPLLAGRHGTMIESVVAAIYLLEGIMIPIILLHDLASAGFPHLRVAKLSLYSYTLSFTTRRASYFSIRLDTVVM